MHSLGSLWGFANIEWMERVAYLDIERKLCTAHTYVRFDNWYVKRYGFSKRYVQALFRSSWTRCDVIVKLCKTYFSSSWCIVLPIDSVFASNLVISSVLCFKELSHS